jgi:SPP1 gp7 family putative phage head morphogenesis protein
VTALAVSTPIQLGEKSFTSYTSMMSNYWQKWTDEINGAVLNGFANGQTINEISDAVYQQVRLTTSDTSSNTLTRAKRSARQLAITGTNHFANQSTIAFVDENERLIKGYRFLAVLDSSTSQQCRSLDQKVIAKDSPKLSYYTPPLHPNCRSRLTYEVADKYKLDEKDSKRASNFDVNGKRDPKQVTSDGIYYDKMAQLSKADQNEILGPTLGKAFRKMDDPAKFARLTVDSFAQPLTITEMKKRDNALSRILNNP